MRLNTYLHFEGKCKEAFQFYAKVLGGKITSTMTYGEMPGPQPAAAEMRDKIVYTRLDVQGNALMGSDAPPMFQATPQGFSVSLGLDTPAEAERVFRELSDKATIRAPMEETFFAHRFGMLIDKFDIPWMVICEKPM